MPHAQAAAARLCTLLLLLGASLTAANSEEVRLVGSREQPKTHRFPQYIIMAIILNIDQGLFL